VREEDEKHHSTLPARRCLPGFMVRSSIMLARTDGAKKGWMFVTASDGTLAQRAA